MISILSMPWGGTDQLDRMWTSAYQHASNPDQIELVIYVEWSDPQRQEYDVWSRSWMENASSQIHIIHGSSPLKETKVRGMKQLASGPMHLIVDPSHRFTNGGWDVLMNAEWEMNKDFELN